MELSPLEFIELAENISEKSVYVDDGRVHKHIVNYYEDNDSDIQPDVFEINEDKLKSGAMECNLPINKIENTKSTFSCFSEKLLSDVGFDTESHWNGSSPFFVHEGEKILWGDSDYYTSQMSHFSLYSEALNSLENGVEMKLRTKLLYNKNDFMRYPYSSLNSGSVIIQKHKGEWYLVIGKRAEDSTTCRNLTAKIPHGGVEAKDFGSNPNVFYETAKREFTEETSLDEEDFRKATEVSPTAVNWQIKSGDIGVCYTSFIENSEKITFNYEANPIRINVNKPEEIKEKVNLEMSSPQDISDIYKSLILFDEKENLPDLDYNIRKL